MFTAYRIRNAISLGLEVYHYKIITNIFSCETLINFIFCFITTNSAIIWPFYFQSSFQLNFTELITSNYLEIYLSEKEGNLGHKTSVVNIVYYGLKASILDNDNDLFLSEKSPCQVHALFRRDACLTCCYLGHMKLTSLVAATTT